ncbi:diguanylate cyclase [Caenibius sp. WL]|uniref:diguanylate cyclase domain-containing protein n=1 Tax=Caenibius sp. WL TaxID=2872646 RepID=UPI001C99A7E9|nr:diguanylate cyclase [Caenibius sp. WL]QZP09398.1 diguanylate cyclase [Caenibius sp. WL]
MSERPTAPTLRQTLSRVHRSLVLFAVLLVSTTMLISGALMIRDYVSRNLQLVARTVSYTVEPAIVFGDTEAVREGLASVTGGGSVGRIEVVDPKGRVLASWKREGAGVRSHIEEWGSRVFWPQPVVEAVKIEGVAIAEVRVFGSAAGIGGFLQVGLFAALCSLGIALVATNLLARRLQRGVITPLQHVADVARSVRQERAFHRRVPAPGLAEVDVFVQDFNGLLVELQGWYAGMEEENQALALQVARDALTGLGNRPAFEKQLDAAILHATDTGNRFAVLYIDVDRFKRVNDSYGHDAGDTALRIIAERLKLSVRSADKVFRLGGDEFAILLASPTTEAEIDTIVTRIEDSMADTIFLPEGEHIAITLSVGYAAYPDDGTAPGDLVRKADKAMYRDKLRRCDDGVGRP